MSTPYTRPRISHARALIVSLLLVAFTGLSASAANAATPVSLNWTQTKAYDLSAAPNTNRTWLGYLTQPGAPPGAPVGTASPSGGLTGPTVTQASADGDYTWTFAASGGSLNAQTLAGELTFDGTLSFVGPGHGINTTIVDPRIVFDGNGHGQLFATGTRSFLVGHTPVVEPYDQSKAVFNLDVTKSTCTFDYLGNLTLGGIVPSIAAGGHVFPLNPGNYVTGSGPDRTPNIFGSFSLSNAICAPLTGPRGPQGVVGPPGPTGERGPSARILTVVLRKPAFSKRSRLTARVTRGKRFIGYAGVIGRKVRVMTHRKRKLRGRYTFKEIGGKKRKRKIRLG